MFYKNFPFSLVLKRKSVERLSPMPVLLPSINLACLRYCTPTVQCAIVHVHIVHMQCHNPITQWWYILYVYTIYLSDIYAVNTMQSWCVEAVNVNLSLPAQLSKGEDPNTHLVHLYVTERDYEPKYLNFDRHSYGNMRWRTGQNLQERLQYSSKCKC
jgi:hypothetical protein